MHHDVNGDGIYDSAGVHYEDMSDEYNPISSNPGALKDQSSISTAKDQMTHCLEL